MVSAASNPAPSAPEPAAIDPDSPLVPGPRQSGSAPQCPVPDAQCLSALDQSLLTHIFTGQGQPLTLALSIGMSLADFLAWHKRPEIIQAFADYQSLQDLTTAPVAAAARRTIIIELEELVRTTPDPIEKRRAAATLLRAISPPSPRSPGRSAEARRGDEGSESFPRSTNPDRKGGGTGAHPHTRAEGSSDDQDKTHRRTRIDELISLLNKDGTIDRAKPEGRRGDLAAFADQNDAENDQDDDQDLDNDDGADDNSGDEDESDEDQDQDLNDSSSDSSSSPSSSSSRPSSSTPGLDSDDNPAPQSFDQAAALHTYGQPQRLPEGAEDLPKPSKDLTHQQVIATCMNALKNNDTPTPDAGIKTVFNFASQHDYVSIRRAHYDDFAAVFHRGPHQHLLNHDSYTIPPQYIEGGYFGPHCCIHWWHIFVTKAGEEVEFEIGVCKIDNEPDIPLHIATLNPPYPSRPFRPRPP